MIAQTWEARFAQLFGRRPKYLSVDMRWAIKERDAHRCRDCGAAGYLQVHHLIPRQMGGTHDPENLVSLCDGCHRSRDRRSPRKLEAA